MQPNISQVIEKIIDTYTRDGGTNHIEGPNLPSRDSVVAILEDLLNVIFPGYYEKQELNKSELNHYIWEKVVSVYHHLSRETYKSYRSTCSTEALSDEEASERAAHNALHLLNQIPAIRGKLRDDVTAAFEGDPAATCLDEIILCYPGLVAITIYRIAHELYLQGVTLLPRIMTEYAHARTGIDIHPGATIGDNFFIDHGTGVVIGETCEIGNNVRLYQGVTLGALTFKKDEDGKVVRGTKRHPTIEDNVIIYSGATILGGKTVVGRDSVIASQYRALSHSLRVE
jgi:serine O-acetyltransferase